MTAESNPRIRIAGLNLEIHCPPGMALEEHDPAYRQFFGCPWRGRADITVNIETEEMPDVSGMKKIFDGEPAWSAFSDAGGYLLDFPSPSPDSPAMRVRCDPDAAKATVYMGAGLALRRGVFQNPVRYPLDQIILMLFLASRRAAIIHAAGVVIDGTGYIFPGRSGAGKSTLSRSLSSLKDAVLLSDDRIIVRKEQEGYMAYGTPWPGDEAVAVNVGAPLAGIFFPAQGEESKIEEIPPVKSLDRLFPVTSVPWFDQTRLAAALDFLGELATSVPSHVFRFKPGRAAAGHFTGFVSRRKPLRKAASTASRRAL